MGRAGRLRRGPRRCDATKHRADRPRLHLRIPSGSKKFRWPSKATDASRALGSHSRQGHAETNASDALRRAGSAAAKRPAYLPWLECGLRLGRPARGARSPWRLRAGTMNPFAPRAGYSPIFARSGADGATASQRASHPAQTMPSGRRAAALYRVNLHFCIGTDMRSLMDAGLTDAGKPAACAGACGDRDDGAGGFSRVRSDRYGDKREIQAWILPAFLPLAGTRQDRWRERSPKR